MSTVFFKDKFCLESEVKIPLSNRAFRYADGCFESIRLMNGKPVFWSYHEQRLRNSLKVFGIELTFDSNELLVLIKECIKRNDIHHGGLLRLTVYRGGEGKYLPETDVGELLIQVFSLVENQYSNPVKKKSTIYFDGVPLPAHALGNHKTLNKSIHIMAARAANKMGCDEALISNESGNIAEAISSNVFILKNDKVITPPLSDGGLQGTIRQVLIDHQFDLNIQIITASIRMEELITADEIWVTNAVEGLSSITKFQNRTYKDKRACDLQVVLNQLAINSSLDLQGNWT